MSTNSSTNSMVIVAIPDENDRVWKVSSEKVPHLTLLFLGEVDKVDNAASIVQFVEHAVARSLNRFYLPVDRRDELGMAKADVLYFKKGRYDFKAVRDFRSLLLKDDNIKTAYDSTSQFEFPDHVGVAGQPWIPHLTLGYPDSPAKPMPNDWGDNFYSVEFTKIAVWMGDYEGPEFLLKDYWDEMEESGIDMDAPLSLAMGDLEHHGVKGMQWGVRKERGGAPTGSIARGSFRSRRSIQKATGSRRMTDRTEIRVALFGPAALFDKKVRDEVREVDRKIKVIKADEKWDKSVKDGTAWVAVNNKTAEHFNKGIDAVNKKHDSKEDWSNEDYSTPKSPAFKKYVKDINSLTRDSIDHAIKELDMKSPSGSKEVEVVSGGLPGDFRLRVKEVKHADDSNDIRIKVNYKTDARGRATGFTFADDVDEPSDSVAQTMELGVEFLTHHGVKGMHWGERKSDVERAASSNPSNEIARRVNTTAEFVKDVQFESAVSDKGSELSMETEHAIHKKAEKAFKDHDVPAIKAKPAHQQASKFKNRLLHPFDKGTKAYRKEMREAYIKRVEEAANSMTNASGTRQYTIRETGGELPTSKYYWEVTTRHIQHADGDEVTIKLEVLMDEDGFITGTKPIKNTDSMAQTVDLGAAWLTHHGVKGMKWGVRRERGTPGFFETRATISENKTREKRTPIAPRVNDSIGSSGRKKTTIKTKGGEDHPASEDAVRVAAVQQKLKKSGLNALTNKELQEMNQRLNLETQASVLLGKKIKKGPGKKFVEEQLQKAQDDPVKTYRKARKAQKETLPKVVRTGKTLLKVRRLAGSPA